MTARRGYSAVPVSVCSRRAWLPEDWPQGEAERAEGREGKIKQTGTLRRRFLGKPLSAHCFGTARTAPRFERHGAAGCGNPLVFLGGKRHSCLKSQFFGLSGPFRREFRP